MAGFTGTKTQEDIKKNEENKKKKIEEKKNNTTPTTKSGLEKFLEGGRVDENDPNLIMSTGSGASIMEGDTRKKEEPKKEQPKKEQSLVANQFGDKKGKTWNDVVAENGNDPEKIKDWLNNNPDYKARELTKKGMAEFGYKQDENGKWVKDDDSTTNDKGDSTTNDDVLDELDNISAGNAAVEAFIKNITNQETGDVDEEKAKGAVSEYEKRLVEMGAASYDKDGNFVLNNVNAKGWEDWATVLSAGLSVLGLAFGIPIMPINFRKITNKDERDAKIRELQQQYMNIEAANAGKVKDVESSAEAGKVAKDNKENIDAYSEYQENVGAYRAKSDIDTDSEKELIETRTDAQIRADEKQFERTMQQIKAEQDFTLKIEALREQYKEQFAALETALMTGSAKELAKYQNAGMFKDMEEMGISPEKLADWKAAMNNISPTDKVFNYIKMGVDAVNQTMNSTSNILDSLNPLKNKGKGK